jgi:hypothetical protein
MKTMITLIAIIGVPLVFGVLAHFFGTDSRPDWSTPPRPLSHH